MSGVSDDESKYNKIWMAAIIVPITIVMLYILMRKTPATVGSQGLTNQSLVKGIPKTDSFSQASVFSASSLASEF